MTQNISTEESKELERIMSALPWDLTAKEREIQLAINKATLPRLKAILCESLNIQGDEMEDMLRYNRILLSSVMSKDNG